MQLDELEIIKELMDELAGNMEYSPEDFDERLGRKKPEVKVLKIEGAMPGDEDEMMDLEDDAEQDMGDAMHDMSMAREMSPEDKLRERIMKLRG